MIEVEKATSAEVRLRAYGVYTITYHRSASGNVSYTIMKDTGLLPPWGYHDVSGLHQIHAKAMAIFERFHGPGASRLLPARNKHRSSP